MSSARLECAASRLCISGTGLSRRSEERYRQCRRQALGGSGGPWWGGGRCRTGAAIIFSAGDLVGHLNCRYLTSLDLKVARGSSPSQASAVTRRSTPWRSAGRSMSRALSSILPRRVRPSPSFPASASRTNRSPGRETRWRAATQLWCRRRYAMGFGAGAPTCCGGSRRQAASAPGPTRLRYQARPRDQGQHRPAAQPLFGPVGARAAGSAGNGLCRDAR
jgi:hypothetical protein